MFKAILAVGLWVAIISFALTVILYVISVFEPFYGGEYLYYLIAQTSWAFYLSIIVAGTVVILGNIFGKRKE